MWGLHGSPQGLLLNFFIPEYSFLGHLASQPLSCQSNSISVAFISLSMCDFEQFSTIPFTRFSFSLCNHSVHCINCATPNLFLAPGTGFMKNNFSIDQGRGWGWGGGFKDCYQMQLVTCHSLTEFSRESASSWLIVVSVQSDFSAVENQLHLRSAGIRFSYGGCKLDPSHVQFTVGFALLGESHVAADLTGGGAQAVMRVMGSGCEYRWSFTRLPSAHLLCGLVPNRPQTGTDPWLGGWGPLF